ASPTRPHGSRPGRRAVRSRMTTCSPTTPTWTCSPSPANRREKSPAGHGNAPATVPRPGRFAEALLPVEHALQVVGVVAFRALVLPQVDALSAQLVGVMLHHRVGQAVRFHELEEPGMPSG